MDTYTYISVPRINHSLTIETHDRFWEILFETIHSASQAAIHIIRIPKDLFRTYQVCHIPISLTIHAIPLFIVIPLCVIMMVREIILRNHLNLQAGEVSPKNRSDNSMTYTHHNSWRSPIH